MNEIEDLEWREKWAAKNAPWCDVCRLPCIWREGAGWIHVTRTNPIGGWLDTADHEATAVEWSNTSTWSFK